MTTMKRFIIALVCLFLSFYSFSETESKIGFSYHIGDDIFLGKNLEFAFQKFSVNLNQKNTFLETGFMMMLARTSDNKAYTNWNTKVGFSASFGHSFSKSYKDKKFFLTPCISSNLFNLKETKYITYDIFQVGIKTMISAYIPIKKFLVGITFSPQFNFFNLINSSSEKKITYYLREKDSDGNYITNDNNEFIYYQETLSIIESNKEINFLNFQYEFSISFSF